MKVPRKADLPHKIVLYKLLTSLLASPFVAKHLYFKGGSCAAMLGYLDRFSVDLDFDLVDKSQKTILRAKIDQIIKKNGFTIKDESKKHLQFFLKYPSRAGERNTLKLEISDLVSVKNEYEKVYLKEIDKYAQAQTIETMVANKLIALKARWEEDKGIAGRDLYDAQHFFKQGYGINEDVIEDLRQTSFKEYLQELVDFVEQEVSEKMLWEDLNPLLPKEKLRQEVPYLKQNLLVGLRAYLS